MKFSPIAVLVIALFSFARMVAAEEPSNLPWDKKPDAEILQWANKRNSFASDAIAQIGRRKITSAIPLLRKIAAEPDLPTRMAPPGHISRAEETAIVMPWVINQTHYDAKLALARMGDEESLNSFIVGLSSSNPAWVEKCLFELGNIGDRRAVKYLGPFLYREDYVPVPGGPGDAVAVPFNMRASIALSQILPEVQTEYSKTHRKYQQMTVEDWVEWWSKNKEHIEKK